MSRPIGPSRIEADKKTGIFYYYWTENGRSKRATTKTKIHKEALEFQLGREKGQAEIASNAGRWTVQMAIDYYDERHLSIGDVFSPEQIRVNLKKLAAYLKATTYIDTLTPTHFTDYRLMRQKQPGSVKGSKVKDSSIWRELGALKACFNFCAREEAYLGKLPFIKIGKQGRAKDRWLKDEEAHRLLMAMQGTQTARLSSCYRLAAIAWGTGKRKRIIETLQWDQVNFETGRIDFREPCKQESSKKKGLTALSPWMLERLKEFYDQRLNNYVLDSPGKRDTQFRRIARECGFKGVTPHTLRHTWGTRAAQKGLKLFEIAEAMGISQKTAERNYIHHCETFQAEAVLKGAPPTGMGKVVLPERKAERRRIMARRSTLGDGLGA